MNLIKFLPLAALAGLLLGGSLSAESIDDKKAAAFSSFLSGRMDDAQNNYRYIDALNIASSAQSVNLALILRDEGKNDAALPFWVKASLLPDADGFILNQKAWAYLSAGRFKESQEAFLKAIDRAKSTADQAEANLGLGVLSFINDKPKFAKEPLHKALLQGPYVLPVASLLMAWTAQKLRDSPAALAYLRQSVDLDSLNLEAMQGLADYYASLGETQSSWILYHRLLSLDPGNEAVLKSLRKLEKYITGDPQSLLPIRRLSRPILDPQAQDDFATSGSTTAIRVAIFSDRDGKPERVSRIYFMSNVPFRVITAKSHDVIQDSNGPFEQWMVQFRPESGVVELRDAQNNLVYTAKQPVRVVPLSPEGSVLIKSANFEATYGFDPGDRELRGILEIWPDPYGFTLINEANIEDYLRGVVAAELPDQSPSEAYKAEAVVARTKAFWFKAHHDLNLQGSEICDSDACQKYLGISAEMQVASKAVFETHGITLKRGTQLADVEQNSNCGGLTENGADTGNPDLAYLNSVADEPGTASFINSPEDLERWVHEPPPEQSYCEAGNKNLPVEARWIRLISAKDIENRAYRIKYIGAIRHMQALKRSGTGRIMNLELEGTRGTLDLAGEKAIEDVLSPNSLRSTFFTIQPIMDGSKAKYFILWGAGTGSGLGMCVAGAVGQASQGRDWRGILAHYFPKLASENPKSNDHSAPEKRRHPKKKTKKQHTLNPNWGK